MKILYILGSLKKSSYNKSILDHLIGRYGSKNDQRVGDIKSLPMYYEDIENDRIEAVEKLREDVVWADGIVIITPEHNGSIPAALKNALDWMSRVNRVFIDKPVMIISGSPSPLGGIRAQKHLKDILSGMGLATFVEPGIETLIGSINTKLDSDGRLVDQDTINHLDHRMEKFEKWVEKLS